jgi:hypothetical protein
MTYCNIVYNSKIFTVLREVLCALYFTNTLKYMCASLLLENTNLKFLTPRNAQGC